jgi:TonB-dependent SusC/RagA subfamily outer membrane receptor
VPTGSLGSALASLAPRDVGRIDVLKDAAGSGIYGSRGANGVIIITTKRAALPNP